MQLRTAPRRKWQLYIITEFWRDEAGDTVRMTKWLKVATGKSADVVKWIRENKELPA